MAFFGRNYAFLGGGRGVGQCEVYFYEGHIYPEYFSRGIFLIVKNELFMIFWNRNIAEKPNIAPPLLFREL